MGKLRGFYSSYKNATVKTEQLTQIDLPCDAVILSLWSVTDDLEDAPIPAYVPPPVGGAPNADASNNNLVLVYWGFNQQAVHEVAPGETTRLIFTGNARDVYVRALKNRNTRIYFSCFKEEE